MSAAAEQGIYAAFGIGLPLAVWGYLSYLRENRKKGEVGSSSSANQEGKAKKYTSDGRPIQ